MPILYSLRTRVIPCVPEQICSLGQILSLLFCWKSSLFRRVSTDMFSALWVKKKLPKPWPPVLPHWLLWLIMFSSEYPKVLRSRLLFHTFRSPHNKIHLSLSSAKLLPSPNVWNQIKCFPVIMFLYDHTSQISRVQSLGLWAQIVCSGNLYKKSLWIAAWDPATSTAQMHFKFPLLLLPTFGGKNQSKVFAVGWPLIYNWYKSDSSSPRKYWNKGFHKTVEAQRPVKCQDP